MRWGRPWPRALGPLLHLCMSTHLLGQSEEVFGVFLFNGRPEINQESDLSIIHQHRDVSSWLKRRCNAGRGNQNSNVKLSWLSYLHRSIGIIDNTLYVIILPKNANMLSLHVGRNHLGWTNAVFKVIFIPLLHFRNISRYILHYFYRTKTCLTQCFIKQPYILELY